SYLQKAKVLVDDMLDLFWDEQHGGFYLSGKDGEQLIAQDKEIYDGALPSGNSVAGFMLAQIGYLTGETSYLDKAEEMYSTFFNDIHRYAAGSSFFMQSLLLTENPTKEVVIIGDKTDQDCMKLIEELHQHFLPDTAIIIGEKSEDFAKVIPFAAEYKQLETKTTVYICENFACKQPTTDVDKVMQRLW